MDVMYVGYVDDLRFYLSDKLQTVVVTVEGKNFKIKAYGTKVMLIVDELRPYMHVREFSQKLGSMEPDFEIVGVIDGVEKKLIYPERVGFAVNLSFASTI